MVGLVLALFLATQPPVYAGNDDNAACCYALAGNKDAAFAILDKVVKDGWTNTRWMKKDPDLASLHDDARWNAIVAQAEANWTKKFGNDDRELCTIVDADQAGRECSIDDVKKAVELEPSNMQSKWLAAATQDRYLRSTGKPQI